MVVLRGATQFLIEIVNRGAKDAENRLVNFPEVAPDCCSCSDVVRTMVPKSVGQSHITLQSVQNGLLNSESTVQGCLECGVEISPEHLIDIPQLIGCEVVAGHPEKIFRVIDECSWVWSFDTDSGVDDKSYIEEQINLELSGEGIIR